MSKSASAPLPTPSPRASMSYLASLLSRFRRDDLQLSSLSPSGKRTPYIAVMLGDPFTGAAILGQRLGLLGSWGIGTTAQPEGRAYYLTNKGKAWLDQQPVDDTPTGVRLWAVVGEIAGAGASTRSVCNASV